MSDRVDVVTDVAAARAICDQRCGYTVVDRDGDEQPCDRSATGWRWYQDVEHEDALDVACSLHENEGGRRMRSALDEIERLREQVFQLQSVARGQEQLFHQAQAATGRANAALDRVTALCDHTSDFIGEYVCVATVRDAATVSPAPTIGNDGIPHHVEVDKNGTHRCLPDCKACSG